MIPNFAFCCLSSQIDKRYQLKRDKLFKYIQKASLKNLELTVTIDKSVLIGYNCTCQNELSSETNQYCDFFKSYNLEEVQFRKKKNSFFGETESKIIINKRLRKQKRPSKCPKCDGEILEEPNYKLSTSSLKFDSISKVPSSYVAFFDILSIKVKVQSQFKNNIFN